MTFFALLAGAAPLFAASLADAVRSGDRAAALELLAQGADAREREPDGTTALHWAVYREDVALVERLIAAGADVSAVNDYGSTPMGEAAVTGNATILERLIAAGADVDSPNAEGQTALMSVARTGRLDAARLLLGRGAQVDAREHWGGQTALMWAAAQKHPAMVELLIEHGADVDARAAVRDWQRRVTAEPRVKEMLPGGLTPLLYAAREGCVDCARQLVEAGADIDLPDPDGVTPLLLAILNLRFDTAKYLIEAGANPEQWDWWGRTPLYAAIDMNIVPAGGRRDLPSLDDTTGLDIARMLLAKGVNPNFQLKLEPPLRSIVFDRGGDGQALTTGATPLLRAAYAGDVPAVELLLAHDPLVELPNRHGVTPLMAAAGRAHGANPTRGRFRTESDGIEAARLLLAAGGDINRRDASGQTALHGAARKGWSEMVKFLVANGAELDPRDNQGRTPLDYALGQSDTIILTLGQVDVPQPHPDTADVFRQLMAAAD